MASIAPTNAMPEADLLSTPWYEISDEDQDDQETVKRKVADRCRVRREQALALANSLIPEDANPKITSSSTLRRTKTQQHYSPGKSTTLSPLSQAPSISLPSSSSTSLWRASKATSCSPHVRREKSSANTTDSDRITLNHTKVCRASTSTNGEVELSESFDIWYANPSNLKRRGTDCHTYACALQQVGEFRTLSDFYAFHNALDWTNIKDGSIIAYSRKGIKPQWEDPSNQRGGRFVLKQFPRPETESVFTHIALGFFSGMLIDWENYNVVSLHVRSAGRGSDVQLWRSVDDSNGGLTCAMVKADLRSIINVPQMTINWVPNKESVSRNDSRLGRSGRSRGGLGDSSMHGPASSLEHLVGDKGNRTQELVESLYEKRGSPTIPNDLREQIMAQQAADFAHATPVGIGLHVPEAMQVSLSGQEPSPRGSVTAESESSASLSGQLIPSPYSNGKFKPRGGAKVPEFDDSSSTVASPTSTPKPKIISGSRFGFLKGVLSSSTASTASSGNNLDSPNVDKPRKGLTRVPPYPAYELPMQIQAWQQGMEQLQARAVEEH